MHCLKTLSSQCHLRKTSKLFDFNRGIFSIFDGFAELRTAVEREKPKIPKIQKQEVPLFSLRVYSFSSPIFAHYLRAPYYSARRRFKYGETLL